MLRAGRSGLGREERKLLVFVFFLGPAESSRKVGRAFGKKGGWRESLEGRLECVSKMEKTKK